MAKEAKADVDYGVGHLHSHCGPTFHDDNYYCKHFLAGTKYAGRCELVDGEIEPIMWCRLYSKASK